MAHHARPNSTAVQTNESGQITVDSSEVPGAVEIDIANTGCTLNQHQLARVFDRFWRADPSRNKASLHVGLGLALVRQLVTSLGGTIDARVANGKFIVSLRLLVAPPVEVG
ncbi:MAG: ATP-binding protein [Pirellulaceae bacterium]